MSSSLPLQLIFNQTVKPVIKSTISDSAQHMSLSDHCCLSTYFDAALHISYISEQYLLQPHNPVVLTTPRSKQINGY
uniref:Uncharacterized protein n=1 Tax=Schistosoma japonicum TaxID=6182 RepID=C1L6I4_SCHJA|nr:hypothetical protein [Schistosoma japonicum]